MLMREVSHMGTTSKQAVYNALNKVREGYIPLGTYAIDCDTASRVIGRKTLVRDKAAQQIALWEGRRDEVCQALKEDSVELFRKLPCIDAIIAYKEAPILPARGYEPDPPKKIGDNLYEAKDGTVYQIEPATNDVCVVKHPIKPLTIPAEDAQAAPEPPEGAFDAYDHLIESLTPDRFVFGTSGGFRPMPLPGGMENALALYALEPELMKANIDAAARAGTLRDEIWIRPGVDEIFVEDDLAMTKGPLISPAMFREMCLPAFKARVQAMKKHRSKVVMHCCGNAVKIMDQIIEAGIDGYQSIQSIPDMALDRLMPAFGRQLSFWGGVPVELLIGGSVEDVRNAVRKAMELGKRYGGLILGPSHSVAFGTKYENFMAMIEEHDKLKHF